MQTKRFSVGKINWYKKRMKDKVPLNAVNCAMQSDKSHLQMFHYIGIYAHNWEHDFVICSIGKELNYIVCIDSFLPLFTLEFDMAFIDNHGKIVRNCDSRSYYIQLLAHPLFFLCMVNWEKSEISGGFGGRERESKKRKKKNRPTYSRK